MLVKVTKDTVKIIDNDYVLNKGEYHVNKCYFQFSEEYTNDLVKKAIFVHGDTKKEMVIANNQCNIPYEVLVNNEFELRVYAYEIDENEELVLRYSPTYTNAYLREGSYISGATSGEEITPTQFEQYQQALQEGLTEVNDKLEDVDVAITEANNLDADVTKIATRSTLSITKKDGTIQSVDILDGADGATGASGKDGKDGVDGKDGADGKDAKINGVNTISIEAGENVTIDQVGNTLTINSTGGSGGTSDYTELSNKPKINNVELSGNKTTSDLGIVIPDVSNFITKDVNNLTYYTKTSDLPTIPTNVSAFNNDAGYLTSHQDLSNYITKSQTSGLVKNDGTIDTSTYLTQHQDISGKLDTSKVKNTYSTTSGDIYDVTYINSTLGDIETLLGGI